MGVEFPMSYREFSRGAGHFTMCDFKDLETGVSKNDGLTHDGRESMGGVEEPAEDESGNMVGDETVEAASSGKGEQRHLKAASQLLNIALKLVGI